MLCSMNKAQTDRATETPPTPEEERAADLCVLSELVEIQMSIARATQQEALRRRRSPAWTMASGSPPSRAPCG